LIILQEEDEAKFVKAVQKAHSKVYNFSCRAKQDTYQVSTNRRYELVMTLFQEQTRVRYGVNKAYPLDFAAECRNLHKMMANYSELIPARYLS
jgi:replication factor A1